MSDLIKEIGSPQALRGAATMLRAVIEILKRHQELGGTMDGLQANLEGLLAEIDNAPKCEHRRAVPFLTGMDELTVEYTKNSYICFDCGVQFRP